MNRIGIVMLAMVLAGVQGVKAEFVELHAAQIASIAPGDRSASPRILVQWTVPDSLGLKIIDAASISLSLGRNGDCPLDVRIMPLSRSWTAADARWESGWSRAGGEFVDSLGASAVVTGRSGAKANAFVYDAVLDHIAGRRPNFGFIVIADPESTCKLSEFTANDATKLADAKLIIAYRDRR